MISWDSIGQSYQGKHDHRPKSRNRHALKTPSKASLNQGRCVIAPILWDGCGFKSTVADVVLHDVPELLARVEFGFDPFEKVSSHHAAKISDLGRSGLAPGSELDGKQPVLAPAVRFLGVKSVDHRCHLWTTKKQFLSGHGWRPTIPHQLSPYLLDLA
jgi:hypothetical protein